MRVIDIRFTYDAYREMLRGLKSNFYEFSGYDDWGRREKPVILRHDIDFEPTKALRIGQIEHDEGATATYFFLMRTDFYNMLSPSCMRVIEELANMGHEIGLHFDEVAYGFEADIISQIEAELRVFNSVMKAFGGPSVTSVSMHRPSQSTLEADLKIPGFINSYSKLFFNEFKYISDSRHNWKTPVIPAIESGCYPRLHILTHPFWYNEVELTMEEDIQGFINQGKVDRVIALCDNLRNPEEVIEAEELLNARIADLSSRAHRTERMVLRPLRVADAEDMYDYARREEVCRFLKWGPYHDVSESRAWLVNKLSRTNPNDLLLGIELNDSGKLIGVVRAYNLDTANSEFEISYILNPSHQGKGYALEAVEELLRICFDDLGLKTGNAYADMDNASSKTLLRNAGFTSAENDIHDECVKGKVRQYEHFVLRRKA